MRYFVGIDLGLVSEPTAIVVVESNALPVARWIKIRDDDMIREEPVFLLPDGRETFEQPPMSYALRHIERPQGGTGYPQIAKRLKDLSKELREPQLFLDVTGVGKAVTELFHMHDLSPTNVTIIGGGEETSELGEYRVPKRELISRAQVVLQTERLKIARGVAHADLLVKELQNFRVRTRTISSDAYPEWRESENDDLVFALALALWGAERSGGGSVCGFAYSAPGPFDGPRVEW
jgi:hypothetical protein